MIPSNIFRRSISKNTTPIQGQKSKNQSVGLHVESLENRVLMAGSIIYDDGVRNGDYGWNFVAKLAQINMTYRDDLKGFHVVGTEGRDEIRVWEINGWLGVAMWSDGGPLYGETQYARADDVPHLFINGLGGNDLITVDSTAENFVWGGSGNDTIFGGNGWEGHIAGEDGNDVLELGPLSGAEVYGGNDNDVLRGGRLDDSLFGGEGNDTLFGNAGIDFLYGDGGFDKIHGGSDSDFLHGGVGSDTLYGEDGGDILFGGPEFNSYFVDNDTLYGGNGQDWLMGGEGSDYLDGGNDGICDVLQGQRGADTFKANGASKNEDHNQDYQAGEGDTIAGLLPSYLSLSQVTTAYSTTSLSASYSMVATTTATNYSYYAYSTVSNYNTGLTVTTTALSSEPVVTFADTYATADSHFLLAESAVNMSEYWLEPQDVEFDEISFEPTDDEEAVDSTNTMAEPEAEAEPEVELMDPFLFSEEEYVEWSETEWVAEEYVETPLELEEAIELPVEEQEFTESEILEETSPIEIVDVIDDSFDEHEFVTEEAEPQTDDSEFFAEDSIEPSELDLGEEQQLEEFILEEVNPEA